MKRHGVKLTVTAAMVAGATLLASCSTLQSLDAALREQLADDPSQVAESNEVVTVTETSTEGAPMKSTTTVTKTASEDDSEAPESEGDNSDSGAASNKTAAEAGSEAIAKANEISGPMTGDRWTVVDSSFDSGSDLSYVAMRMEQSPRVGMLVALFHKGEFIQFASNEVNAVDYAKETSDGVEVGFHDSQAFLESGDMLANAANYNQPVTFYWDGSGVSHRGEIPG